MNYCRICFAIFIMSKFVYNHHSFYYVNGFLIANLSILFSWLVYYMYLKILCWINSNIIYCHAYIINRIHEHDSRQNFQRTFLRGETVIYVWYYYWYIIYSLRKGAINIYVNFYCISLACDISYIFCSQTFLFSFLCGLKL